MTKGVGIIDYGVGNLHSVMAAFAAIGETAELVSDPAQLLAYDSLLLPGVGSFREAKAQFDAKGFSAPLHDAVVARKTPLLGICVGMQMLGHYGDEDGGSPGLGFVDGQVHRFSSDVLDPQGHKIPHVGFNTTHPVVPSPLFDDLPQNPDFYYTHSFRMMCDDGASVVATCTHGETFAAVVGRGHIFGTQFHPEKSQSNGLTFLKNYTELARCQRNA